MIRDRFGVSASEALHGMPAWEYDLLAEAVSNTGESEPDRELVHEDGKPPEPKVPRGLMGV